MKKTMINVALVAAFGSTALSAQAANIFTFTNGSGGSSAANVSWFSMLASDTDSDGVPDTNIYTSLRGTNTALTTGSFNMDVINTLTLGAGTTNHNSGNMIDRDWSFFSSWGAHYTTGPLEITNITATSANVNMAGWTVGWNGGSIDMGAGALANLSAGADNTWGTGDERLDYSATVPTGDFAGVAYAVHFAGTMATPVPVPATAWIVGSGLIGLVGLGHRRKRAVAKVT